MATRKTQRRHRTTRGGGYQTSQQFFDPTVLPPHVSPNAAVVSTGVTESAVRPVLVSTFQAGAARRTRRSHRVRGGFNPSVMGPFVANAQAAVAPLAMYSTYRFFNNKSTKNTKNTKRGGKKNRKSRAHGRK